MKHGVLSLALVLVMTCGALGVVDARSAEGHYGGGGPVAGTLRLSLTDLNNRLTSSGFAALDETVVMVGGGGTGGTVSWNMGGWGVGGASTATTATREAQLSIGLGGFSVERCLSLGSATLTGGLLLGGGSAELILTNVVSGATLAEALATRYETHIKNNFLAMVPMAGVRVKLARFIFLDVKGGYLATVGDWKMQGRVVSGLPKIGGTMVNVGVVFGGSTK